MKSFSILFNLTVLSYISISYSFLEHPNFFAQRVSAIYSRVLGQVPIMNVPNIVLPPSQEEGEPSKGSDDVIISDVIGKDRVINIFAGFTRDVESISKRLENGEQNTTVLAPLNSEIQKLPRKPWEDPKDYENLGAQAYDGASGEDRARKNLRRFVQAHVIPASPWKEGDRVESLGGGQVWWEDKDGVKIVCFQLRFGSG